MMHLTVGEAALIWLLAPIVYGVVFGTLALFVVNWRDRRKARRITAADREWTRENGMKL